MTENLKKALEKIAEAAPVRIVVSGGKSKYRRVNIDRVKNAYLAEKLTETQAFHEKIEPTALFSALFEFFVVGNNQLHAFDDDGTEYHVRVTKKAKVLESRRKAQGRAPSAKTAHNREKPSVLPEGADIPVLRDMGVITANGKIAAGMYGKYRQVNRFLEILDDVYREVKGPVRAVDFGCGKSYLTFLVYYYFTEIKGARAEITGLDLKADVIENCRKLAEKYGYSGLSFIQGSIEEYTDFQADLLISLHACDTATDYALHNAVKNNASVILAAPCCQHELGGQMKPVNLGIFLRYGLLKERASAILTDAIRANLLTYCGYKVQVLEFAGLEHTSKNLLIRAVKSNIPEEKRRAAYGEVMAAVEEFGVEPMLLRLFTANA